ncbi:hypothetical protein KDW_45440 [Dictyobacter vulcani]|uniref:Anaphase-promoting complex subunit 5 domain-containing protein n=1 Tax=Dictyobacter vulcani TaxID=2607529 RepID=A0A5J4KT91_9CHLR|nr:tetratricopeptide repeat protein [Dictyobacter vulcani]GER90382.1 hypothetical protein KDW_45440 [Dictyobacter vulcani]
MSNQKQSLATITEQYTFLLQNLCDIATSYYLLGNLKQAQQLLDTGIQLAEDQEVSPDAKGNVLLHSGILQTRSIIYRGQEAGPALATLLQARAIAESTGDQKLLASVIDWTGQALYYQALNTSEQAADFATPLMYFENALEQRQQLQDDHGICETLFNIGRVYQNMGQDDQAHPYFVKALALAEQHNHQIQMAEILLHLGAYAQSKGDLEAAKSSLMLGMTMREALNLRIDLPFSYLSVGNLVQKLADLDQAALYYQKAALLAQEMDLPQPYAFALLNISYLHLAQEQPDKALTVIEEAISVAQTHNLLFAQTALQALQKEIPT